MFYSQEAILHTTLRPETVAALENVSFSMRAKALPRVKSAFYSIGNVPKSDENQDEGTINVSRCIPISPDIEERMVVLDRYIIAGGLAYDHWGDVTNPCENNAFGNIYHYGSRSNRDELCNYYAALGFDRHGNKNLSDRAVVSRIAKHVMKELGTHLSILKEMLECLRATKRPVSKECLVSVIQLALEEGGLESAFNYIIEDLYGTGSVDQLCEITQSRLQPLSDLFSKSMAEACWDQTFAAGEVGAPLTVVLDIYKHGNVAYSVSGTGRNCQFDTSRGAAVWVPDQYAIDNIRSSVLLELGVGQVKWFGVAGSKTDPLHARFTSDGLPIRRTKFDSMMRAQAEEYCKDVLEEYNDWANGNIYGVLCYVIDRSTGHVIDDDESWGHLGTKYAEDQLDAAVLAKVLEYGRLIH